MIRPSGSFEALVQEALAQVPAEFLPLLENVPVIVEEEPDAALMRSLELPEDEGLYGTYTGTPLPDRPFDHTGLPDRIILYRRCLMEDFPDPDELREEILVTVVHEIAHHFGIGEDRLEELGLG
jgi:predicted Zn-dependent protease with MMP-like domain